MTGNKRTALVLQPRDLADQFLVLLDKRGDLLILQLQYCHGFGKFHHSRLPPPIIFKDALVFALWRFSAT